MHTVLFCFVDILITRVVNKAMYYDYLFFLVNLRIVLLEPCETKNKILLIQTRDYKKSSLQL